MKILIKGIKPKKILRYKKCNICKTKFLYDKEKDLIYGTTFCGTDDYIECVKCPICDDLIPMSFFDRKVKE